MKPVALKRVCLRNCIVARNRQVRPCDASAGGSNLGLIFRGTVTGTDAKRPSGQIILACILSTVCVFVIKLASSDRGCRRRCWCWCCAAVAGVIRHWIGAIRVERRGAQVARPCVAPEAVAREDARVRLTTSRAIQDRHRLALRCHCELEGVHTLDRGVWVLGGRVTVISARVVLNHDLNGRVVALIGAVGDATQRHLVGAAGLNVPELIVAAVYRVGDACPIDSGHTGDGGIAQVVRGGGMTDGHTHCDRRDNGGPDTFAIWFHFYFFVLFWVLGAIPVAIQDVGIGC